MRANRLVQCGVGAGTACVTALYVIAAASAAAPPPPPPPQSLQLTGLVRDFRAKTAPSGHPDFQVAPNLGFGIYNGNVAPMLGSDGKPVFTGGGWLTKTQWKDSNGRAICYRLYNPSAGDVIGVKGGLSTGAISSANSFNQWYNDVPGVNMSQPLTLTLNLQSDKTYVFDDKTDPKYS